MKISEISSTFCMVYECYKRPAEIGDSKPLVPKKKLHGRIAVNSVNISFSPNKSCFGYLSYSTYFSMYLIKVILSLMGEASLLFSVTKNVPMNSLIYIILNSHRFLQSS